MVGGKLVFQVIIKCLHHIISQGNYQLLSMTVINSLMTRTCRAIVPRFFVVSYSIIAPREVSSFIHGMTSFASHDGVVSVSIIRIQGNNLWRVRRVSQSSNRVSRGNRNGICDWVRDTSGYFVWYGTIINGNVRDTQIWTTKINQKDVSEAVIKFTLVLLSH